MLAQIIQIGNSQGIRIPSLILKQMGIKKEISLEVIENEAIVIKPFHNKPRHGWEKDFEKMHEMGDDNLILDDINDKDNFEWEC